MRLVKSILGVLCSSAMLVAAAAAPASAQNFNRHTVVTFNTPVELPGMTLPAGTYTFRLSDSTSDRNVVHVLDANAEKHIATLFAMPASRSEISDENVITFRETAANQPLPLRYWYFPNDRFGQEFAYPAERALAIAQATGESVLSVEGEQITRVEPTPAPVVEPEPVQPVEPAPVQTAPVTEPAPMPMETERLPDTASPLPLIGLVGLMSLGGALVIRAFRRSAA